MQRRGKTSVEKSTVDLMDGRNIPKDLLCEAYIPKGKPVELFVRFRKESWKEVAAIFEKKNIVELCSFQNLDPEKSEVSKGILADISGSKEDLASIVKAIEGTEGVLEVRFSNSVLNGLIIDELFFPLLVGGERSFTLRVDSFGAILKRLYEKFGTGAAIILYEMGLGMGESKFKSTVSKYRVDKQTAVKILLAERSAKGWCIARVGELNSKGAMVMVYDLFECMPFKNNQEKPVSQLFRGYLTGIFQQLYGKNVTVTESECIAKGDNACRFLIRVAE
ncbi:MAG: V4R domain-containing protein [Thermoproteota archaeon]